MAAGKIVPEFLCTDIEKTKVFYTEVLGFDILYERPEETFAYLSLTGADIMFEQVTGFGRRWITAELQRPFGRGINLQIEVENIVQLYEQVLQRAPFFIYLPLEEKNYLRGNQILTNQQFIVQDIDGYLLRFAQMTSG